MNLSPAYVINLAKRLDKKSYITETFSKHGITDYKFFVAHDGDVIADGSYKMSNGEIGCSMSHISAIQEWFLSSPDQNNLLVFEDDVSLEGLQYWSWSWEDFIAGLPEDYDIIHLSCNGMYIQGPHEYRIKKVLKSDLPELFTTAYLISRNGAKKILDKYATDTGIVFNFNDVENVADNMLLYGSVDNVYKLPVFFADAVQFKNNDIASNNNQESQTVTIEVRDHTLSVLKHLGPSGISVSDILKVEE